MSKLEINDEVRASLTEAGIGPRFHDRTITDVPHFGERLFDLLKREGPAIRTEGRSLAWHGVGLTEAITMFCRALHVNGVGCFMRPLVRLRPLINDPDFREVVTDIPVLAILNGQDTKRGNPLHDSVMAEVEYVLRKRHDASRATFIQLAVPEGDAIAEMPNCYWSDEFLSLMSESYTRVTPKSLMPVGTTRP